MANVFNDGDPLNIDTLNTMYTDILKIKGQVAALSGGTSSNNANQEPTVPVIHIGSARVNVTKNVLSTTSAIDVGKGTTFRSGELPRIVCSVRSTLKSGQQVSASIIDYTGTPTLHVMSNENDSIQIDWICIFKRPIA